jgi:hypothetical protein
VSSVPGVSQSAVSGVSQPAVSGASQPTVPGVAQPAVVPQPAVSAVPQPAQSGGGQPQTLANDMATGSSTPKSSGKKQNLYAQVMKASKTLAQTGPGPVPIEAMNYFNKFGGAGSVSPQVVAGPQTTFPVAQQAPAMSPQQRPAVSQPIAPQQNVQQYYQQQQQQQALQQQQVRQQRQQQQYNQQRAAYQFQQDQRQNNPYYNKVYRQPRPFVSRNGNYHPPAPRPYPLHQDELDKPTGKVVSSPCLRFKKCVQFDYHTTIGLR